MSPVDEIAVLLTWNPDLLEHPLDDDDPNTFAGAMAYVKESTSWSTGGAKSYIQPGVRVFLLRQGTGNRGIIASGRTTSNAWEDDHWDGGPRKANYVDITWDLPLKADDILPIDELKASLPEQHWQPQSSGTRIKSHLVADLERLWADHRGKSPGGGQGPRTDSKLRLQIENAAQNRLMCHFRDEGWSVTDTRHNRPYDALATKDGEALYLEAKGTTTAGGTVLVTEGEVNHARTHAGQCVMGILSELKVIGGTTVDAASGRFRVFPFNPDTGELRPTQYTWTPIP